tara:strand:+ start:2304 stop:3416 length:1113 start_codon:yes stop_codon:yes gene_type:complete
MDIKRSDFNFTPYLRRSNLRATWQLLTTFIPITGLWVLLYKISHLTVSTPLKVLAAIPIIVILVLLSSRAFSLMHDCGHGLLFETRWLNTVTGFLLGCLNAIPQHPWSRGHAYHHKHNGNWELYKGPCAVKSLIEYKALSKSKKRLYKLSRHPFMLFPGGFYYLIIKPRLALVLGISEFLYVLLSKLTTRISEKGLKGIGSTFHTVKNYQSSYWYTSRELADIILNNFVVVGSWILMSLWLGTGVFWTYYSIIMTCSAAIFICIFFVQHNFEGSYANGSDGWSPVDGALEGSSNLEIPRLLNWFFADISFHSIHHLCDRIPNYNLRLCHYNNQNLLQNTKTIKLKDIQGCFEYILWDSESNRLTTIKEAS